MWLVVIWTSANNGNSTEFDTKEAAYKWANSNGLRAYTIEVYGPNGYYDAVE
jgi:hypothetical protein